MEDRLDLLRYLDEFHYWHSLDDQRRCKRCGRVITGRQILVKELQGTRGKLRLQCPTVACVSRPSDWVYADPVLAAKLRTGSRTAATESRTKTVLAGRTHGELGLLRKKMAGSQLAKAAPARDRNSIFAPLVPFRAVLARLPLLRPLATALHGIRPVA